MIIKFNPLAHEYMDEWQKWTGIQFLDITS